MAGCYAVRAMDAIQPLEECSVCHGNNPLIADAMADT